MITFLKPLKSKKNLISFFDLYPCTKKRSSSRCTVHPETPCTRTHATYVQKRYGIEKRIAGIMVYRLAVHGAARAREP